MKTFDNRNLQPPPSYAFAQSPPVFAVQPSLPAMDIPPSALGFLHDDGSGTRVWRQIASSDVTTALGFTPYNASNPSGFINGSGNTTGSSGSCTGNAATATNASQLGGVPAASYATQSWVSTSYAPLASPTFTGKVTIGAPATAGTSECDVKNSAGTDVLAWGTTGATYSGLTWLPASSSFIYAPGNLPLYIGGATAGSAAVIVSGYVQATAYKVGGTQVLTSQQTGMGATIAAYTLSGTYATDLAKLQALYNQVLALVTALKVHGLVAT